MTAADENAEAAPAPAEPPVTLTEMWRQALAAHDNAAWWRRDNEVRIWAGVLRLIDACAYAHEGTDRDYAADDKRIVRRLREIARDRDILKDYAPARRPIEAAPASGAPA